jgi:acetyltransferase-like isoleucine patch superfamily enzyme
MINVGTTIGNKVFIGLGGMVKGEIKPDTRIL